MTGIAPVLKVFSLLVVFKSLVMHVTEEELGASGCVLGSPLESGYRGG